MKKFSFILLLALVVGFFHVNAQSINLKLGLFYPSMSRDSDLWDINFENLALSRQDMASEYFGIEYEHFFGKNFSLSLEGGIYSKTVYTMYKDYEFEDGSPIEQDISLRIFSFEIDFKIYPVGHKKNFCPFFGVGAGMYNWKYVQGGDFIIFDDKGDGGYVEEDARKAVDPQDNADHHQGDARLRDNPRVGQDGVERLVAQQRERDPNAKNSQDAAGGLGV